MRDSRRLLKIKARRITAEIRHVLLNVWDPIGVAGLFETQDEYDCCLGSVYRLLVTGATDNQIAEYLWLQGTEHIGLTLQKEAMYPTVAALRKISLS